MPRRIPFVTLKPVTTTSPNVATSNVNSSTTPSGNVSSSNEETRSGNEVVFKTSQPATRRVGFVTLQSSQNAEILVRKEKPPIPLEPEVIIIE